VTRRELATSSRGRITDSFHYRLRIIRPALAEAVMETRSMLRGTAQSDRRSATSEYVNKNGGSEEVSNW
jgi:hypothetical protein